MIRGENKTVSHLMQLSVSMMPILVKITIHSLLLLLSLPLFFPHARYVPFMVSYELVYDFVESATCFNVCYETRHFRHVFVMPWKRKRALTLAVE